MKKAFVLVALWLCVLSGGVAAGTAEGQVRMLSAAFFHIPHSDSAMAGTAEGVAHDPFNTTPYPSG